MKTKTPKPTAQHMQKLADLMDTRPEGVTTRQVQNTLSVSPAMAKAALVEIGATEVDGKWVFVEPVAIAEPAPVEPVTIEPDLVTIDWSKAPDWAKAAVMNPEGVWYWIEKYDPYSTADDWHCTGDTLYMAGVRMASDPSNWRDSKVLRPPASEPADYNVSDLVEAFAANPPDFDPLIKSVAAAKSDFAVALEAERQRVFDAVAIGGTVERLAELTGLHVDDVQMHLDALIVDGAIFREPIIIGYGHKVAV